MADDFSDVAIVDGPLSIGPVLTDAAAGAVVDFLGVVRALEHGAPISGIQYDAHPKMARHQLVKIAQAAGERFQCEKVILHHRIGFVPVAAPSLFLRVFARHRAAAFAASQWIVEELKAVVPIWKTPFQDPAAPV
ncbi:MAG: molybdopterin synthase catalytic subunit [Chthoniobacter sp.]|jgi:molybdopterin synthase catalytic subunit|nr:molybdopterin synthase catalytic subunit [Chthoniobacter sp.]